MSRPLPKPKRIDRTVMMIMSEDEIRAEIKALSASDVSWQKKQNHMNILYSELGDRRNGKFRPDEIDGVTYWRARRPAAAIEEPAEGQSGGAGDDSRSLE